MTDKLIIKKLTTSSIFKVLNITGKAGNSLKKHKVDTNTLLLVNEGTIAYQYANQEQQLSAGECFDIPIDIFHEVTCTKDASFFVIMPNQATLKFEK